MKILTKEEEDKHYRATVQGGILGGLAGLAVGTGSVFLAQRRYPAFRSLTVPFRAFLGVSVGTFSAIIAADRASRRYEMFRNKDRLALTQSESEWDRVERTKPFSERAKDWAGDNRYSIVFGSWLASMAIALQIVRRDKYLTGAQKLVQARVYAQGLTIAVLLASFAIETKDATQGKGRWETIKVLDPSDPMHKRLIERRVHHERYEGEDQWMDVIAAEEEREIDRKSQHANERKEMKDAEEKASRAHHLSNGNGNGNGNGKSDKKSQSSKKESAAA